MFRRRNRHPARPGRRLFTKAKVKNALRDVRDSAADAASDDLSGTINLGKNVGKRLGSRSDSTRDGWFSGSRHNSGKSSDGWFSGHNSSHSSSGHSAADGCGDGCDDAGFITFGFMLLATLLTSTAAPLTTARTVRRAPGHGTARIGTALIRLYQANISAHTNRCLHPTQTCSAYGLAAITNHGLLTGLLLTRTRIRKCHP